MVNFCRCCSLETFGEDIGDLAGLCRPDEKVHALCEGCDPCWVDHEGLCIDTQHEECKRFYKEFCQEGPKDETITTNQR